MSRRPAGRAPRPLRGAGQEPADDVCYGTMGHLAEVEKKLGGLLDGLANRVFGGRLSPRAVLAALAEGLEERRLPDGRTVLANVGVLRLHDDDVRQMSDRLVALRREAEKLIRQVAEDRALALPGRPRVRIESCPDVRRGSLDVVCEVAAGPGPAELLECAEPRRRLAFEESVVIGRDLGCELCLEQDGVSRRHARIEPRADHWVLTDLGSTNGTFVNGAPVSQAPLTSGEVVAFGPVAFEFREL